MLLHDSEILKTKSTTVITTQPMDEMSELSNVSDPNVSEPPPDAFVVNADSIEDDFSELTASTDSSTAHNS